MRLIRYKIISKPLLVAAQADILNPKLKKEWGLSYFQKTSKIKTFY
jgi:hypothetical protein